MTRALRIVLLALLGALVAGFLAGTVIRLRLERPVRYIGALASPRDDAGPLLEAPAQPALFGVHSTSG